jgi:transporter family protein
MPQWLLFALLSSVFAAAVSILAKIGIKGVDSNLATAIRTIVVTLFTWGIVVAQGSVKQLTQLSRTTWIFLVLSGLATGLSWLFYFRALQLGDATRVVPIDKLSLVLAVIMAVVFLHEKLTMASAVGALLITAGVLVMAMWR